MKIISKKIHLRKKKIRELYSFNYSGLNYLLTPSNFSKFETEENQEVNS